MFKRLIIFVIAAVVCASAVICGCSAASGEFRLEAEKAVIEPEYDENSAVISRANSRSENITSNGKYVGKLYSGNTVTWFFTAEKQVGCSISIAVANASAQSSGFYAGAGEVFSVELNGVSISFPMHTVAAGTEYCDNWQLFALGEHRLLRGINKLVYTALSDEKALNVDYLSLSAGRSDLKEHNHFWKSSSNAASCTEGGYIQKSCADCGYSYASDRIAALGHQYGNYHYSDELMKMVAVCERCGDEVTANTPNSKYFGEVFYSEDDFTTRPDEVLYEAEDAFVCIDGGLNNGSTYIKYDDGTANNPSGGKIVENISNLGNYIRFRVDTERECEADLVFRMSNTMFSPSGIAALDPMSDFVYCSVNGAEVDFTFVSFPGFNEHSYYEWRYVLIKNVEFTAGVNLIEVGPKDNAKHIITMPNTDVLKIYTDGAAVKIVRHYMINDASAGEYSGRYGYCSEFSSDGGFIMYAGAAAAEADYELTIVADAPVPNLAAVFELSVNYATVKLEGIALTRGENTVVLKDVPVRLLENTVSVKASGGVVLTCVRAHTPEYLPPAYDCAIDPEYDYIKNSGKPPSLILEAEGADLGDSVSSREGVELIEYNIYENTGKTASGNSAVGNFAVAGNVITWSFESSEGVAADLAFMLASANYDSSVSGNVLTDNLQRRITVKINGVAVNLKGLVLTVDSLSNYYDWKAVTVRGCRLVRGLNVVTIEAHEYGAPNMDVLYVHAKGAQLTACV